MTTLKITVKPQQSRKMQETAALYDEATEDYEFWSKDFNMHFGYYSPLRTNPLKRDSMLNEMNRQVFTRLGAVAAGQTFCDLGCGMGGTMRYGLKKFPGIEIFGVTLSEFQCAHGNILLEGLGGTILNRDYNHTGFPDASFDGAFAIESFCHSGHSLATFREAYRILRPGGSLVIGDAFLKKPLEELCIGGSYCYKGLCDGWALEQLGDIKSVIANLQQAGFREVFAEDISMRVAPSVLHVPFAIGGFILRKLIHGETLKKQSLNNLKGSLFALLSGVQMNNFGYYLITCKK